MRLRADKEGIMVESVRASATLRWGLVLGTAAGVVAIVQGLLPFFALSDGADRVASYTVFLVYLALYFASGLLTVREGQSLTAGAIAGLLVAVISQALAGLVMLGVALAAPLAYARSIGQVAYAKQPAMLALTAAMGLLIALMVYGSFGAALGALGGLVLPAKPPAGEADARGHGE
jgi:hypothetical protein